MLIGRRDFLAASGALLTAMPGALVAGGGSLAPTAGAWAKEPMRWFQLAFTEDDPGRYDKDFWLDYFRSIHADGVCLSAGGGIAFYPTDIPDHGRARGLDAGQDPFGEMVAACKSMGLRVLARIDPHAMNANVAAAHPEWALINASGEPQHHASSPDLTLTCAYGGYNFDLMPRVIEEIGARYPVDGFFGNRWNGSGTCHCASCQSLYRAATGEDVPANPDPSTPEGRAYAAWVSERLFALIDRWNVAASRHRPDAFFIPGSDRRGLVDLDGAALAKRLPLAFGDRQARSAGHDLWSTGPEAWGAGRYVKALRAFLPGKPVGQIISVGVEERYRWKDSVQDPAEIRIWAAGSIAQGALPWVTKFNAKPLDTRWMAVVRELYDWHHAHERYLRNTANLAEIGLVISSRTPAFLGGWKDRQRLEGHEKGFYQALLEARLPFEMIDDALLSTDQLARFRTLVLANAAVLSDRQCDALRHFVQRGGRLVATHETSLYDETGRRRANFGLADLFGCSVAGKAEAPLRNAYLAVDTRHSAVAGFGSVRRMIGPVARLPVAVRTPAEVAVSLIPSYPDLPMERVFTEQRSSDIAMMIARRAGAGRVVYMPMDLDRSFAELSHGDHLRLLGAAVAWAHQAPQPLQVEGPGMVDIAYWRQEASVAAHLVNLNNPMTMRGSYREPIRTGPYRVTLLLPEGRKPVGVRLLEAGRAIDFAVSGRELSVTIADILVHEVVAVDLV